jgi:hypothetical protein
MEYNTKVYMDKLPIKQLSNNAVRKKGLNIPKEWIESLVRKHKINGLKKSGQKNYGL